MSLSVEDFLSADSSGGGSGASTISTPTGHATSSGIYGPTPTDPWGLGDFGTTSFNWGTAAGTYQPLITQGDVLHGPVQGGASPQATQFMVNDFLNDLRGQSPEQILAQQKQLEAAGLLDANGYQNGRLDRATVGALSAVISNAQYQHINFKQSLSQILKMNAAAKKAAAAAAGPKFFRADPVAVEEFSKHTFQQATGRDPNSAELKKLIGVFRAGEGPHKTPEAHVQKSVESTEPAQEYRAINFGLLLSRMLGGS